MAKVKIAGTGLSGMVGSRVVEILNHSNKYEITDLSLETGVDITDKNAIEKALETKNPEILLHFAAYTDVDKCEQEKELGEKSRAWQVNVLATSYLVDYCKQKDIPLLYISTDFVFNGDCEFYREDDKPNPANFYGETKYHGEEQVLKLDGQAIICRISFPYRAIFKPKVDLVRTMLARFRTNQSISAVTDQLIVPTFIDDIAAAIFTLVEGRQRGVFHVVGSESIQPVELAKRIADCFGYDSHLIKPITRELYYQGRALRPARTVLKNDKIRDLGINMRDISSGLAELKKQLHL